MILADIEQLFPLGTELTVEHDGFSGTVIGYYTTREGKSGVVIQQHGNKVVHVYSTKWFNGPLAGDDWPPAGAKILDMSWKP